MNQVTPHPHASKGLISTILVIIVALIILGYFKIDVRTMFSSTYIKDNLQYGWQLVVTEFNQLIGFSGQWIQNTFTK